MTGGLMMISLIQPDAVKLLVAMLLGAVIGLEREASNKAAGLRTITLICMGATLFTITSMKLFDVRDAHILAQIVSGIGFLVTGAILRDGDHVIGLTTAATIWMVAAIGIAVGSGFFNLAGFSTACVLVVQLALTPFDTWIDSWRQRAQYRILSQLDDNSIEAIKTIFRESNLKVLNRKIMKKQGLFYSEWYVAGSRVAHKRVIKLLTEREDVTELNY
jgi:putative Mg2+ transporter-C (MgtC) family protein